LSLDAIARTVTFFHPSAAAKEIASAIIFSLDGEGLFVVIRFKTGAKVINLT